MNQPSSPSRLSPGEPFLIIVLGVSPVIAVVTTLAQGVLLGITGASALILTSLVLKTLRRFLPDKARIPLIIITATVFITIGGSFIQAARPDLRRALGMYLPLQAVSCLILALAVPFEAGNSIGTGIRASVMAAGRYAVLTTAIGLFREAFGLGTVLGWPLFGAAFRDSPLLFLQLAPGGFMTLGFSAGLYYLLRWRLRS